MEYTPQAFEKLSAETASRIMGSGESWTSFLSAAARLYKYTFQEQLLIYAQRPDATACAPYEVWNDRMRRYVKRGSKGIALIDEERVPPKLRYVFGHGNDPAVDHTVRLAIPRNERRRSWTSAGGPLRRQQDERRCRAVDADRRAAYKRLLERESVRYSFRLFREFAGKRHFCYCRRAVSHHRDRKRCIRDAAPHRAADRKILPSERFRRDHFV